MYGVAQAINAGDTLFTLSRMALHRLTELGFSDAKVLALMRLYDETCLALCEGQFMDIWSAEHDERLSVDFYFDMIGRKTAALIAGVGAGRRDAGDRRRGASIEAYRGFGWSLGIAFQLNDDLLGIWGDEETTGKEPSDLAKHKKTLPLIYALERAPADGRSGCARSWRCSDADGGRDQRGARDHRALRRPRVHARASAHASATRRSAQLESAGVVGARRWSGCALIVVSAISA